MDAAGVVIDEARRRDASVVGITGGVAVGKSTLAEEVAAGLGAAVLAVDGFLYPNAVLAERGLLERKGHRETFDRQALLAAVRTWATEGRVEVPVYSHRTYDRSPQPAEVAGARLVVEGLHLADPELGLRAEVDLLVHLDAADGVLVDRYLRRFGELRRAAAEDPAAFLHPYREVPDEAMDAMALDVWHALNQVVLDEEIRPVAPFADLVIVTGSDHRVLSVSRRAGGRGEPGAAG